jgi:sugar/nucleoside kinase (ribokinase family)
MMSEAQLSGEYSCCCQKFKLWVLSGKKRGHGAHFHDKDVFFPALPLEEVFDPTGAGDLQEDWWGT